MGNNSSKKYLTTDGHRKAEEELAYLIKEKRPLITKKIETAKDMGDLSENAEYADAKDEQAFTEARIIELTHLLKFGEIVSEASAMSGFVDVGSKVTVTDNDKQITYTIVGFNEADPSSGKISNESPLAQALLHKRAGESVEFKTPRGIRRLNILNVE